MFLIKNSMDIQVITLIGRVDKQNKKEGHPKIFAQRVTPQSTELAIFNTRLVFSLNSYLNMLNCYRVLLMNDCLFWTCYFNGTWAQ